MSLEALKTARRKTVGAKQTIKALERQSEVVHMVFVARDAEEYVIRDIVRMAQERGLEIHYVDTMAVLGKACGIEVGAATAAILAD